MLLYGKNSIYERLKANPSSIKKIYLQDNFNFHGIENLIKSQKILTKNLPLKELAKIKPAENTQGIIAEVEKFEYAPFDDTLAQPENKKPNFIFLDRIYDPQNLGAIMRTAACFGGFSIVIPRHNACEVTETVLHVASGAENYVPVAMVSNLSNAIIKAKEAGWWIMAAVVDEEAKDINKISIPFPLGLVLGSEGEGVRYGVQKHADIKARSPMKGAQLSFNVTIACAIFCYEISRQRS